MPSPDATPVQQLSTEITELPERAKNAVRRGFEVAATLSEADRDRITKIVIQALLSETDRVDEEAIAKALGIARTDAARLATAYMITIGLLTQWTVSADEFIAATRDSLFGPSEEDIVLKFARSAVSNRRALETSRARARLASTVLPSLEHLSVAVDLRIEFDDDRIKTIAPVAIVRIDTDIEGQALLIQLSKFDVGLIIDQLSKVQTQMSLAENAAANAPFTKEEKQNA